MLRPTAPIEIDHGHLAGAAVPPSTGFTRREMLTTSLAITGAGLAGFTALAYGQQPGVRPTNEQILGPFYPMRLPADQDADLTIIAGKNARALGQVVYVSGRVINVRGEPVVDAELEIWQANAAGRYSLSVRSKRNEGERVR